VTGFALHCIGRRLGKGMGGDHGTSIQTAHSGIAGWVVDGYLYDSNVSLSMEPFWTSMMQWRSSGFS
jgi:pheromone shutdown protein TraB